VSKMAGVKNSKLKLLVLADILEKYTDEEHSLNANEICDKLQNEGISAERKSIYKDIDVLREFGYDIIKSTEKGNAGYFLGERKFQEAEIRLISDAIQAANFISANKTAELVEKFESFLSEKQSKILHSQVYVEKRPKTSNERIYYTISELDKAINKNLKVNIVYQKRKITEEFKTATEEKTHKVSPYALIWSNDSYYLICNNEKYDNLMHVRIDRIKSVSVTNEKSRHFSEVSNYTNKFDAADYANKSFNMFSGEPKPIQLICKNELLDVMLDRFGKSVKIQKNDENSFILRTNAAVSEGLIAWILQFGPRVKVKSPNDLIYEIKKKAEETADMYN
jgi:predicted DNA-binding transcriptional regulator YafY